MENNSNNLNQQNDFNPNTILKNPNENDVSVSNSTPNNIEQKIDASIQFTEPNTVNQPIQNQPANAPQEEYSEQIKQWLKAGTITEEQAKKMQADSSQQQTKDKSSKFISIVATIGAVLIFIGFAWLLAKNWHQIPALIKIIILVGSTIAAFICGVLMRQKDHDNIGRALMILGSLLYILSVFLIAQIYSTSASLQGYAWLLLLCWTIILLVAYFLDSQESLVIGMVVFFQWAYFQYFASVQESVDEMAIFGLILIFLSSGALLFGINALHRYLNHKFANVYRFWTVFYFLLIFYILSFQFTLPALSEYSVNGGIFSFFLVLFILICLFGFIFGIIL